MKNLNEIVAENITNLRKSKDLTQQELAEKFNYSDKTVSKWELGQAIPSVEVLKQLGDYFGVTVDYFLHENSEAKINKYKIKSIPEKQNQIIITALGATAVLIFATVIFVYSLINKQAFGGSTYWQAFVWMVPIAAFISYIFVMRFFRKEKLVRLILTSLFLWGMLASIYLHVFLGPAKYGGDNRNIWYIFFVGIPLEILIVLINKIRK